MHWNSLLRLLLSFVQTLTLLIRSSSLLCLVHNSCCGDGVVMTRAPCRVYHGFLSLTGGGRCLFSREGGSCSHPLEGEGGGGGGWGGLLVVVCCALAEALNAMIHLAEVRVEQLLQEVLTLLFSHKNGLFLPRAYHVLLSTCATVSGG